MAEALGTAATRQESDAMMQRYRADMAKEGWGFWAVEVSDGAPFVGMVGLHRTPRWLPCSPAVEVGWRLHPDHWGRDYATEAAAASLAYGFDQVGLEEIVAYTTTVNVRSQSVMERIGMRRDPGADFDHPSLPEGSPLRQHVLYRVQTSQRRPSVAP